MLGFYPLSTAPVSSLKLSGTIVIIPSPINFWYITKQITSGISLQKEIVYNTMFKNIIVSCAYLDSAVVLKNVVEKTVNINNQLLTSVIITDFIKQINERTNMQKSVITKYSANKAVKISDASKRTIVIKG